MFAGFAEVDITPPVGSLLDGFIARTSPSTGVEAPLSARALWLEDGDGTGLVIGLDVLGLAPGTADRLARRLADGAGIPEDRILLSCTHTHSGPMTVRVRGIGDADEIYVRFLEERVADAAARAFSARRVVKVAWGTAPVSISVNRRRRVPGEAGVVLGPNPDGPTDPAVRVMHLRGADSSIILFHHACHPYCLGADWSLISPDFWGHAAAELKRQGHDSIYLNGCSGNIESVGAFGGPDAARTVGRQLAQAVLDACRQAHWEENTSLRAGSRRFAIPHEPLPPLAEVEQAVDRADRTVRDDERTNPLVRDRIRAAWSEWLRELKQAAGASGDLPALAARVSIIRVGCGVIVALPGEVFYEIGRRIAGRIEADPVCVAAYCHGYIGYVPTPDAYAEGGYEVDDSHRYVGLWRISREAGTVLENQVIELWRQFGGQVR